MNKRIKGIEKGLRLVSTPINLGGGRSTKDPRMALQLAIKDALDPTKMDGPVRALKDMSPEERAAIEKQYGTKIIEGDRNALVTVEVFVSFVTERAVLVLQGVPGASWHTRCWLPRSMIENGEHVVQGPTTLRIPAWKALRAKLRRKTPTS